MADKRKATPDRLLAALRLFPNKTLVGLLFSNFMPVAMLPTENNPKESEMVVLNTDQNIERAVRFKINHMEQHCENVNDVFFQISKPNRLQMLELFSNIYEFSEKDYSELLIWVWTSTEFPHQLPIPRLVKIFERANTQLMMDDEEKHVYANFPETVTIYRGTQDKKAKVRGLSWTTNYETADRFCTRWKMGTGNLYSADIRKKDILLYTNGRNENEVVVNPRKLIQLQKVK
jgi:hypothetical protein